MSDERGGKGVPAVSAGFYWQETSAGLAMRCTALDLHATHAFTTRHLEFRGEVSADYARLAAALSVPASSMITVSQVHGRDVLIVRPGDTPRDNAPADVVITSDPGRVASVRIADCVPVLLADRRGRAVAAVHAGWRGTVANAAGAAVAALESIGVPPADLIAAVGPSIGPCCYQVDEAVRTRFLAAGTDAFRWFAADGAGRWKLDLWQANADQLVAAGLAPGDVHVAALCTFKHPAVFFSYRRDGVSTGRMVAAIRLGRAD
jgi:YfiH family protein